MSDLYPWQKEVIKQLVSNTARGNISGIVNEARFIFTSGRQCGKQAMFKAMTDARAEFEKLNGAYREKPIAFVFLGKPCEVRGGVLELAPMRTHDVMPTGMGNVKPKPKPYYHRDRNGKPARW